MRRALKISAIVLGGLVLLLTAMLLLSSLTTVTPGRVAKTTADLITLQMASSNYFRVYSVWPKSIHDLESDRNPQKIVFIAPAPATNDAWGRPLVYVPFDPSLGYGRVLSYGRNGKPGGDGPDADIEFRFAK
jgi:general secretion pathway protein G